MCFIDCVTDIYRLLFYVVFYVNAAELSPSLLFTQTSTQAGWLRLWMPTCWWRAGRHKVTSCPPTAPCPDTPWTSRGCSSPDRSTSSPTTTTQSGACHGSMRTRWPAWGIWTGRKPSSGVLGGWSAPSTPWFTRPSGRWWTGTSVVERERKNIGTGFVSHSIVWVYFEFMGLNVVMCRVRSC